VKKNNVPAPATEAPTTGEPVKPALNIEVPLEEINGGLRPVCRSHCPWRSGVCTCWAGTSVCQSR